MPPPVGSQPPSNARVPSILAAKPPVPPSPSGSPLGGIPEGSEGSVASEENNNRSVISEESGIDFNEDSLLSRSDDDRTHANFEHNDIPSTSSSKRPPFFNQINPIGPPTSSTSSPPSKRPSFFNQINPIGPPTSSTSSPPSKRPPFFNQINPIGPPTSSTSSSTISGNTTETATGIITDIKNAITQIKAIAKNKSVDTDSNYTAALTDLATAIGATAAAPVTTATPPVEPKYYTPPANYNDTIIVTNNNIGFLKFPFTGKNPDGPLKQLDLYAMLLLFNMITPNAAVDLKTHLESGGKFSIKEASIKWLLNQLPLKVKASGDLATSNAVDTLQMVIDKVKKLLSVDFASVGGEGLLNSKLDISTDLYQISYFIARDRQYIQKSGSDATKEEHVKNMNNILFHLEELRKIIRGADKKVRGGKSPKLLRRSRKQKKEVDSDEDVQVSD
jgi:hypothetical protein